MPSLKTMTSIVSEESLVRDRQTRTDRQTDKTIRGSCTLKFAKKGMHSYGRNRRELLCGGSHGRDGGVWGGGCGWGGGCRRQWGLGRSAGRGLSGRWRDDGRRRLLLALDGAVRVRGLGQLVHEHVAVMDLVGRGWDTTNTSDISTLWKPCTWGAEELLTIT